MYIDPSITSYSSRFAENAATAPPRYQRRYRHPRKAQGHGSMRLACACGYMCHLSSRSVVPMHYCPKPQPEHRPKPQRPLQSRPRSPSRPRSEPPSPIPPRSEPPARMSIPSQMTYKGPPLPPQPKPQLQGLAAFSPANVRSGDTLTSWATLSYLVAQTATAAKVAITWFHELAGSWYFTIDPIRIVAPAVYIRIAAPAAVCIRIAAPAVDGGAS